MNQAQGAIDAARAAGAEQFAAAELMAATDALKRSEEAVAQRDYRLALSLAIDSRERAQIAARAAGDAHAQARGDAERHVAEVTTLLTQLRARLKDPATSRPPRRVPPGTRTLADAADKAMQEARAALKTGDYARATKAADGLAARLRAALSAIDRTAAPALVRRRR